MDALQRQGVVGLSVLLGLALVAACLPVYADPIFSGNVETDFIEPGVHKIVDPDGIDVGLPAVYDPGPPREYLGPPPGTISGLDMKDIRFFYNSGSDVLFVGINTYVIAGDVDGDGDPAGTSAWLAAANGTDYADFGDSESFAVMLDIDEDGTYDAIAGVSPWSPIPGNLPGDYSVNEFDSSDSFPWWIFGPALPAHQGDLCVLTPPALTPDLEFTIERFSKLADTLWGHTDDPLTFGFKAFVGSMADDGIGEDFIEGTGLIPEPFSAAFMGSAFAGFVAYRVRKRKKKLSKR